MLEMDVDSGEKVILFILKNLVNPVNDCYPSHALYRIARFTGLAESFSNHGAGLLPEGGAIDGGVSAGRV